VSGRRGVHHDVLVSAAGGEIRQLQEPGDFVDARKRQPQQPCNIVGIQPGPAQGDGLEQLAPIFEPVGECVGGVDFHGLETGDPPDLARERPERLLQRVPERRRRVGRHDQGPLAAPCGEQPEGRRARRLADAPLASDQPECGSQ
jgi:hypothetical protein